ncbi:MAG: hypothetical protein JOZ54_07270 [Acidobacteria bacterium]|nr:hypothetical protein [Acidobacteriota bacterium]
MMLLPTLAFAIVALSAPSADTFSLQIAGHQLRAGERFTVLANVEYTILNPAKGTSAKRADGGRELEESWIEFRASGKAVPSMTFKVPLDGEIPARTFKVRFQHRLAIVPDRMATLMVHVASTRIMLGDYGKPKEMKFHQTFPVPLSAENTANGVSRCLLFTGEQNGGLGMGLQHDCAAR